jgi:Raf kinase inhibitor-like YbhB/YbcL family protein
MTISPPLAWDGVPQGTKSLVLIIDDPDAPDPKAPQMVWVHWVVYNIPPDMKGLPENASKAGLPKGTELGMNDFKKTEYGGPVRQSVGTATSINSTRWILRSI